MNKKLFSLLPALLLAGCCFAASSPSSGSSGTSSADNKSAPLEFANTWAAGGPYSLENLKGKIVVLYFYVDT